MYNSWGLLFDPVISFLIVQGKWFLIKQWTVEWVCSSDVFGMYWRNISQQQSIIVINTSCFYHSALEHVPGYSGAGAMAISYYYHQKTICLVLMGCGPNISLNHCECKPGEG